MVSDENLMEWVRDDVPGAFEELLDRYQHRLVNVINGWVGNIEEAEELAQEVFASLYRSRKKYVVRSRFSIRLYTIAHNLMKNRKRGTQPE
jgi:RNA polymerase sigma-70 factor (ECF subfamily)